MFGDFKTGNSGISFDGVWEFAFRETAELETLIPETMTFNDFLSVPGCFDCQPDYYCKRGVGCYRTRFELAEPMADSELSLGGLLRRRLLFQP